MAIVATYYAPMIVEVAFYLGVVIAYFYSDDEPFWLAFFLVVSDGFMGFFGAYIAVLSIIPGLPPIEVGQFYILLALIKAINKKATFTPFFNDFLKILLVYIIFLIVQGYVIGVAPGLSKQFSVFKSTLPFSLFYSIPILFDKEEKYKECFKYLFVIAITAFFSQAFTITFRGITPAQFLGATKAEHLFFDVTQGRTYRGFFSTRTVLISMFGAMVFLPLKSYFNNLYLFAVLTANFSSAFLSATRGWVVSFGFMIISLLLFVIKIDSKRMMSLFIILIIGFIGISKLPIVKMQIDNAFKRLSTLEALAEGDVTAGGTLGRLDIRAPRVIKKWKESPLTGWGFSEEFAHYEDGHVGNQNILLHSGIIGAILMALFFLYFNLKIFLKSTRLPRGDKYKGALLACNVFFAGWFLLHSTSGQQFAYYSELADGFNIALFFSFAALLYEKADQCENQEDINNENEDNEKILMKELTA